MLAEPHPYIVVGFLVQAVGVWGPAEAPSLSPSVWSAFGHNNLSAFGCSQSICGEWLPRETLAASLASSLG